VVPLFLNLPAPTHGSTTHSAETLSPTSPKSTSQLSFLVPKLERITPDVLQHNPRASLAAWLKYENIVVAAFRQHPKPYTFSPTSHKSSTVCSRVRDAIRGAIAFGYPIDSGRISTDELSSWWKEVVVKPIGSAVMLGLPTTVDEEIRVERESSGPLQFTTLSLDEIIAFTVLLSSGRILGPITIFNPPDVSMVPERENVDMLSRADGSLILM